MTKPYDLLILGHHKPLSEAFLSVEVLTHFATSAFRRLPHVQVHTHQVCDYERVLALPRADIVLFIAYWFDVEPTDSKWIKRVTEASVTASLREVLFPVDYCFTFKPFPEAENAIYVPLQCDKASLPVSQKTPGTILVDHAWQAFAGTDQDWTTRIEEWLSEVADRRSISRMVYYKDYPAVLPPFVTPLPPLPYHEYLKATAHFERFICTHAECYPHGVIDMAARGTQVLAPPGFLPECIVKDLGIPTFSSKEELLALLSEPVGDEWNRKIDLCTDYGDVAKSMDGQFQEWLA